MSIQVTCPNRECRQACVVQDQFAGMQVACPKCQTVFNADIGDVLVVVEAVQEQPLKPEQRRVEKPLLVTQEYIERSRWFGTMQKGIVGVGLVMFALVIVFPRWVETTTWYDWDIYSRPLRMVPFTKEQTVRGRPIVIPPISKTIGDLTYRYRIDLSWLTVELLATIAISALAYFATTVVRKSTSS